MATEMGIFETIYNCRAMRRLKPDPVPEELLVKLIDAANQAPTGSNQQGARWIVVRGAEQRSKLAALNKAAATRYIGARTEEEPPDEKRKRLLAAVRWQAEHMQDIPALVIACYQFGESVVDHPEVGTRAGGSIWPAVQNLLLAARARTCCWPPARCNSARRPPRAMGRCRTAQAAVREVLQLPDDMAAFCLRIRRPPAIRTRSLVATSSPVTEWILSSKAPTSTGARKA